MMPIPEPLISDIAHGRCLPFIGAGFSKNAILPDGLTMPDWNELASLLQRDAGTPLGTTPPQVAQQYEHKYGRVQLIDTIREVLHATETRPGRAHEAFTRLPFDTIYTTNFDLLFEEAYAASKRPYRSLVGEHQLPFHAGKLSSSIVKMHGDLRHEEHIVVTQGDYDRFMEKYPVIATHLAAMLITRTPLYLGYSLSDPDFNNIRAIVRSRLGQFERISYVVQFDVDPAAIEAAYDQRLHIISLPAKQEASRSEVLAGFFSDIQQRLDANASIELRASRPDVFEDIKNSPIPPVVTSPVDSSLVGATSKLCFVMMPFSPECDRVYRLLIEPVVREHGLVALRADEMSAQGPIVEQIRTAIQQARLCIADLSYGNPNVMFEVGLAQAIGKSIIFLASRESRIPFDVAHQRVLLYDTTLELSRVKLSKYIEQALSEERLAEAQSLFDAGQYRAAIASSAVVLEHRLTTLLSNEIEGVRHRSIGQMLAILKKRDMVDPALASRLDTAARIRNRALHELEPPTAEDADQVLSAVRDLLTQPFKVQ